MKERDITEKVRLSEEKIFIIQRAFRKCFGPRDSLWIFGSRTDMSQRGGDIDLYIESQETVPEDLVRARDEFYKDLMVQLGEQKIDIVIKCDDTNLLIYNIAQEQGVRLV